MAVIDIFFWVQRTEAMSKESQKAKGSRKSWNSSLSYAAAAVEYALVQYPGEDHKKLFTQPQKRLFQRDVMLLFKLLLWDCVCVCVCWSLCSHLFEAFFFAHGVCDTLDLIPFTAWLSFQFSVYLPRRLPLSRNWQCKPTMLALARRYCTGFFKK